MEFLLEPVELGSEFDDLVGATIEQTECGRGYVCDPTGKVDT